MVINGDCPTAYLLHCVDDKPLSSTKFAMFKSVIDEDGSEVAVNIQFCCRCGMGLFVVNPRETRPNWCPVHGSDCLPSDKMACQSGRSSEDQPDG